MQNPMGPYIGDLTEVTVREVEIIGGPGLS
jgi:hypothetical protein